MVRIKSFPGSKYLLEVSLVCTKSIAISIPIFSDEALRSKNVPNSQESETKGLKSS